MDLKATYNRIGEDWSRNHALDSWWHEGTDRFISFLKPGASVLDLGCGGGIASKYFVDKGFVLTGIDFSKKMIEIGKREVPEAKFFVMNLNDIAELPENFDGIYGKAVLLHVPKKEIPAVIKKIRSKLKTGGYLYVAVKEAKSGQEEEQIKIENDFGYEYSRFFSFFFLPEVERYFTDVDLAICYKKVTPVGKTKWIEIIGQKV